MARSINRLSATSVTSMDKPGRYADGGNLYLVVTANKSRSWAFIFRDGRRQREMGLGSANAVTLARARKLAAQARAHLAEGIDPIEARRRAELQGDGTFSAMAQAYFDAKSQSWKSAKVRKDWIPMMKRYCKPIWEKGADEITSQDVYRCLSPIWSTKAETARKIRGRIEAVLDAARVQGLIPEDKANVARWRGHLSHLLPPSQRLQRGHHAALPYAELPAFLAELRLRPATAARCLEFLILTAARSAEAIGARWSEFDLTAKIWTVPAARMKGSREHRVPLSDRAIEILKEMEPLKSKPDSFVFPGQKKDHPLSVMSLEMLLRRMDRAVTVHGFRSTFRDWAGEAANIDREIAETALAHQVGSSVERAYWRGDVLEKRRAVMQGWADYCAGIRSEKIFSS